MSNIHKLGAQIKHHFFKLIPYIFGASLCFATISNKIIAQPNFLKTEPYWVDSLMSTMTLDEKIGQLLMVTAYPTIPGDTATILKQIEEYGVGGILFLKSSPDIQKRLSRTYQSKSKIPLFMAMDAETGLSFRMDSVVHFPDAIALGAIKNDSLIFNLGIAMAQQCKEVGININFSPVADVNTNPKNPIINHRSFGEDALSVANKTKQLMSGMLSQKILCCAKHFPGHGDTSSDSHHVLPVINKDVSELKKEELLPFQHLIDADIPMIMTAHLSLPRIDSTSQIPSSLSRKITSELLKAQMGFKGLAVTDAMNMKAISNLFGEGEAAVQALIAGNDIIEFIIHPHVVIEAIKKAIKQDRITEKTIDQKCRKILLAKKWIGLNTEKENPTLRSPKINEKALQLELCQSAITLIQNKDSILPMVNDQKTRIATISFGMDARHFASNVERYSNADHFSLSINPTTAEISRLFEQLNNYEVILLGVKPPSKYRYRQFGLNADLIGICQKIIDSKPTIFTLYGIPYALDKFDKATKSSAIIIAYNDLAPTQQKVAETIFGAVPFRGVLPVSINKTFPKGIGINTKPLGLFRYDRPENSGINSELLNRKMDSLANMAIKAGAFPGCQILIAKDGNLLFHKSYGYLTYDSLIEVTPEHIYDWASITKITGPLPALMKLYDEKKLSLNDPLSKYDGRLLNTNKSTITFKRALAHQARLQPWIPFWYELKKSDKKLKRRFVRERPSSRFSNRVSDHLYARTNYKETIIKSIIDSELLPRDEYKYSGLAFYLFPDIISTISGDDYENYLKTNFFNPMNLKTVSYNPYRFFPRNRFIPTEIDGYFRKTTIAGYVHDEGCALMGGTSGNAGLFGNTLDLAKIMQMYLQNGYYNGQQLIDSTTIKLFTSIQYPEKENRRGLGFDKPYIDNKENQLKDAYPAPSSSYESYGHSGFTGTFTWADPQNGLLLVFMSNRVYPTRNNSIIYDMNFRPVLHETIYNCLNSYTPKH